MRYVSQFSEWDGVSGSQSQGSVCCELQSQFTRQGGSLGAPTRGQGLHRLPLLRPQLPEGHHHFITEGTSPLPV